MRVITDVCTERKRISIHLVLSLSKVSYSESYQDIVRLVMMKFSSSMIAVLPWKEPWSQRKGTCPWGRARGESPQSKGQIQNVEGTLLLCIYNAISGINHTSGLLSFILTTLFLEHQCRQRKPSERSRRFRPSNKASKNLSRLKMQRGGSEIFMVPHRVIRSAICYPRHLTRQADSIRYYAWCAVCYYRYTNRNTGMHQQEVILLVP